MAGQAADEEGTQAHQQQGGDQHLLPADAVTEVAEYQTTQRSGKKARTERAEGHQRGGEVVHLREEHLGKHQCGGGAVDDEVIEFQRRPQAGDAEGSQGGAG